MGKAKGFSREGANRQTILILPGGVNHIELYGGAVIVINKAGEEPYFTDLRELDVITDQVDDNLSQTRGIGYEASVRRPLHSCN